MMSIYIALFNTYMHKYREMFVFTVEDSIDQLAVLEHTIPSLGKPAATADVSHTHTHTHIGSYIGCYSSIIYYLLFIIIIKLYKHST